MKNEPKEKVLKPEKLSRAIHIAKVATGEIEDKNLDRHSHTSKLHDKHTTPTKSAKEAAG